VQLMSEGDRFRFFVPPDLAYGDNSPSPVIPPGSVLIFEVELLAVLD
jgi:FKBP-type peptidyl-prolyl cis-trans isomerase FklB